MYGGSIWLWFAILIPAEILFTFVVLCFRSLIHRSSKDSSHPALTLFAFVASQGIRGTFVGFSLVRTGLTDTPNLLFRVGSGAIFVVTVLTVIAVSIAVLDQHTATVHELELRQQELVLLQDSMGARVEEATSRLRQFVKDAVSPKISAITESLDALKSGTDKSSALLSLQKYVDDELRPLSHRIAHEHNSLGEVFVGASVRRKVSFPTSIDLASSLRPLVSTLLFFLTFAAAASRTLDPLHSVLFDIPCLILLLLYFYSLQAVFAGRTLSRKICTVLVFVLFGMTGPLVIGILTVTISQVPLHVSLPIAIIGFVYGLANLMYTIATAQRDELAKQLETTILALSQNVALLRQREWIARRRISLVVHGTLQSSLNAAAVKLGATSDVTHEMIDVIRFDIEHALDRIQNDQIAEFSFPAAQNELSHIWRGTIEIRWHVDLEAYRALNANPATSECLGEVVSEAIGNAARHGGATKLDIHIKLSDLVVVIRVIDNGHSTNAGITHGLGSELFNDVCTKWSLARSLEGGMVFTAHLALEDWQNEKSILKDYVLSQLG